MIVFVSLAFRPAATLEDDVASLFENNCTSMGCHGGDFPAMGMSLAPKDFKPALIDRDSRERPELKLVDTRNPEKSYLLMKVRGDPGISGSRMPLSAQPLSEASIGLLAEWAASLQGGRGASDIPQMKADTAAKPRSIPESPAFWGIRLVNLPTPRSIGRHHVLFRVSHRFYPSVKEGYDAFYGLNGPASILVSLGYGITDSLSLTLGHGNRFHEWILSGKWRFWGEGSLAAPLTGALNLGAALATEARDGVSRFSSENFKFSAQLSLAYRVSHAVSLLLSPGYASNTNHWAKDSEGTLALGLGGRIHLGRDYSFLAEMIPVLAGNKEERPGFGLGLEKKIGGHVFQVFALNSVGITESQYLPGGDLCPREGDFRFGFTIFRWF
jgi:hypothetical protein